VIGRRSHGGPVGAFRLRVVRSRSLRAWCAGPLLALVLGLSGCGPTAYSLNAVRAARSVEKAKQVGAMERAPYEMTLANAYLEKAREESAEAAYQDAVRFAKLAQRYAEEAAQKSRETGASR